MWRFVHSVECPASADFAWHHWTTVSNWAAIDSSIDIVEIDRDFVRGARGVTVTSAQDRVDWLVAEAVVGTRARIDFPAPDAILSAEWTFDAIEAERCRITQRLSLSGARARDYEASVAAEMERGVPAGMSALAAGIAAAFRAAP